MSTAYALLIQEDVAQLQAAEKAARDKSRTDRVRLLRFLKEERVPGLVQAAAVLGYSVRTAERWWQPYGAGGLAALVAPPRRRGLVERLTPAAWAGLQAEMRAGHIGGLHEAQVSRRDTWHIDYGIDAVSKLFRRRKTKLKTGRPRHRKAASAAEPAALKNELAATVSRLALQRVLAMDGPGAEGPQARFGLKATHRRLWCPFGSRPPWPHEHQYHWFWLYAAVEPVSGTCVVLFLPHVDGVCFERFLEVLRRDTGADTIGLVLDNRGS
jgi:transposase